MTALLGMDSFTRFAPAGFAFRDASDLSPVGDGLKVRLTAIDAGQSALLTAGPSGYWSTPRLPALPNRIARDPAIWAANRRAYRIDVSDDLGRFLPISVTAQLPIAGRFLWPAWQSLPEARIRSILPPQPLPPGYAADYLPLFATIARTPPGPRAMVRMALAVKAADGSERPARWAVATVTIGNRIVGLGMADAGGAMAISFPYRALPTQTAQQTSQGRAAPVWQATIRIYWDEAEMTGDPPDLATILGQLDAPVRTALDRFGPPPVPLPVQNLVMGRPLSLATKAADGKSLPCLYLQP